MKPENIDRDETGRPGRSSKFFSFVVRSKEKV
jgi:hypothetical protein